MLRKSLQVLVVAVLSTLVAIVAFASLGLSGPDDTLAEAARLVAREEYVRAIAQLDLMEGDVQGDATRAERLWRLRYAANTKLGNTQRALDDVERLLRASKGDKDDLRLDQIRLLALAGKGEAAKLAAQRFLVDHPGQGRALELAGEACQTLYQPELRELLNRHERDLPAADRAAARALTWSYLYRPDGDPEVATAHASLAALHGRDPRLQTAWQSLALHLEALRGRVQEGLGFFRSSLEAPGEPVAAFRAFALSLDQSRRIDDLLVACEIQRRRFSHKYVDEAGAAAAWALLREGQDASVIATVDRWLPPGTVQRRIEAKELGAGTLDLLVARAWAAHRSGDGATIGRMWQDASLLWTNLSPAPFAAPLCSGLLERHNQDLPRAQNNLRYATELLMRTAVPIDRLDLLPPVANLWLDVLRAQQAAEPDLQRALGMWQNARPATLPPLLARSDVLLDLGRAEAAAAALEEARNLAPDDEVVLAKYLALMRTLAKESGQDGEQLFAQCLRLRTRIPEVRHPIGYLLCGEVALAQQQLTIARSCAVAAIDAYPSARAPRLLEIRVSMAASRFDDAARQAAKLVQMLPPDAATVELALAAHRAAEIDCREWLASPLTTANSSPSLQAALLRQALATRPATARAFVIPAAAAADAPTELQLLAAEAMARAGDPVAAATILDRVLARPDDGAAARPHEWTLAFVAWLEAAAVATPDAGLDRAVSRRLAALGEFDPRAGKALLATARRLATSHPATALALMIPGLASADAEDRSGRDYELAGQLAVQAGRWRLAEECWTAALAFADRSRSAEALARLCLAQGRPDRAAQVRELVDVPDDPALAMRFDQLELAAKLVGDRLLRDRADLLAHCVQALVGQAFLVDWRPAEGIEQQNRVELLCLLREPALAAFALPRIEALCAAEPRSRTNRLLLARVYANLGQGDRASAIHQELDQVDVADPVFYREVALAAAAPGYLCSEPLRYRILVAATRSGIADSAVTLAFVSELMTKDREGDGAAHQAELVRLAAWRRAPHGQAMTAADLQLVATKLPPLEAWTILDQALSGPFPIDRAAVLDRLHELAYDVVRTTPAAIERLHAAARRHLATDGPRGAVVHFLLDHQGTGSAPAMPADERTALAKSHLAEVAAGRDDERHLPATLRRLQTEQGAAATVADLDGLLRQHPTTLALWLARAELSVDTSRAGKAVADLRAVLQHADAPELQLAMLVLAAEARTSATDDRAQLDALPANLRESPTGKYAAALLELRAGRPEAALADLAVAPPQADGMHLFALALAALQGSGADGPQRARAALAQLARDYPSSSLARNAGSFASQLALP